MAIPLKEQAHNQAERLRKAASPEVAELVKLLELRIEVMKDQLLTAQDTHLSGLQGAAKELRAIINSLTVKPPTAAH